jgi:hypothetical protein
LAIFGERLSSKASASLPIAADASVLGALDDFALRFDLEVEDRVEWIDFNDLRSLSSAGVECECLRLFEIDETDRDD